MELYGPLKIENFINRVDETERLGELSAARGMLIVVTGRRRVGKTCLIEQHEVYQRRVPMLKFEGLQPPTHPRLVYKTEKTRQLRELARVFSTYVRPRDAAMEQHEFPGYIDFFSSLADSIESWYAGKKKPRPSSSAGKPGGITILLDEIQWMAAYGDELFSELKTIWDNRLAHLPGLRLYISGSSPSFVASQFSADSALFGREDLMVRLKPFTITETARYLRTFRNYGRRDILSAQLLTGGVVGYLESIAQSGDSVFSGLASEFFRADGRLFNAYDKTFVSSLAKNAHYRRVIQYLANRSHANREQIARHLKASEGQTAKKKTGLAGGRVTVLLDDLVGCEFIERYCPLQRMIRKSRLVRYRIQDAYLNFYHRLVEPHRDAIVQGVFHGKEERAVNRQQYAIALGLAFERFMIRNHGTLAEILQFADTSYTAGSFFNRGCGEGFQVDLLFIRQDDTLVFCEIKHWHAPVSASRVSRDMEEKIERFHSLTRGRYAGYNVRRILLSTEGTDDDTLAAEAFDRVITLEDLFSHWAIS